MDKQVIKSSLVRAFIVPVDTPPTLAQLALELSVKLSVMNSGQDGYDSDAEIDTTIARISASH